MDLCPKCGARLLTKKVWVEEEPKYTKVWEYDTGWQVIEQRRAIVESACPKCSHKRMEKEPEFVEVKRTPLLEKEPKLIEVKRTARAPLPDIPLSSRRYYPCYMSRHEYFREQMRQADMVESITRNAPSCERKSCRFCGGENKTDVIFCEKCGKRIE